MQQAEAEKKLAEMEKKSLCSRECPGCPVMLLPAIITLVRQDIPADYEVNRGFPGGTEIPGDECTGETRTEEIRFGFSVGKIHYEEDPATGHRTAFIGVECLDDSGMQLGVFYLKPEEIKKPLPRHIQVEGRSITALQRVQFEGEKRRKTEDIWRPVDPLTGALLSGAWQSLGMRINTEQLNLARMESGRTPLTPGMKDLLDTAQKR